MQLPFRERIDLNSVHADCRVVSDGVPPQLLPEIARQSFEGRLAAASVTHRSSIDSFQSDVNGPFSSTTVRRRSTSLIHMGNGEVRCEAVVTA